MRASILFFFCFLIFAALVAAVVGRELGFFDRPEPPAEPEVVVVKPALPKVIVPLIRMPENVSIFPDAISERPMTQEEYELHQADPDLFMPPIATGVMNRVTTRILEANEPIKTSDLMEDFPASLADVLTPGMRPVSLSLPRERCQGGTLAVGDWVNVVLATAAYPDGEPNLVDLRTGVIAHGVRLVMKRSATVSLYRPAEEGVDLPHTIEANPYRAALIEYAMSKGLVTLTPVSQFEADLLEAERVGRVEAEATDWTSSELGDEEIARIESMERGELSISDEDLMDVFGLEPIEVPPPAPEPPVIPTPPPVQIAKFVGTSRVDDDHFPSRVVVVEPEPPAPAPEPTYKPYRFSADGVPDPAIPGSASSRVKNLRSYQKR